MGDVLAEEWAREVRKFRDAAQIILGHLALEGRIPINEQLFSEIYNDLNGRLIESRGWWNPLLSPYSVYHFYDQAIMVLSPVSSEAEFSQLYNLKPREVTELVEEGLLIVMLSAPHTRYSCRCFEEIVNAQGTLPTVLRLTETIKSVLSLQDEDKWIYNTKYISNLLREELGLRELHLSDMATRISDLAALGYVKLAKRLVSELTQHRERIVQALVRSLHHILVEPIIDSGATIGAYSRLDIEFIEKAAQSTSEIARLVEKTLWSLGTEAKIRVPRRFSLKKLRKFLDKEDTLRAHEAILEYRYRLRKLAATGDPTEIKEIAGLATDHIKRANRSFHSTIASSISLLTLGFIAQIPINMILPTPSSWLERLLATIAGITLSSAVDKGVRKATEKLLVELLTVQEHVLVLPVTPMIFEVKMQ